MCAYMNKITYHLHVSTKYIYIYTQSPLQQNIQSSYVKFPPQHLAFRQPRSCPQRLRWPLGKAAVVSSHQCLAFKVKAMRGARAAQLVKRRTPDFASGHDLTVMGSSPASGSMLTAQSLLRILSPPASRSLPHSCALSQNKCK